MIGKAIDATLGELFTTRLARVLVAIAGVLELLTSNKELENQLVRFATHEDEVRCACSRRGVVCLLLLLLTVAHSKSNT